jgi:hypothetical protein
MKWAFDRWQAVERFLFCPLHAVFRKLCDITFRLCPSARANSLRYNTQKKGGIILHG